MRKTFTVKYSISDPVVLKTQPDQVRIVSGYLIREKAVTYGLVLGDNETWHQDIEIEPANAKIFQVRRFHK